MANEQPENAADAMVTLIEQLGVQKKRPTNARFDELHSMAITCYNQIDRLATRLAFAERDSRETFKTIRMLQESGLIDEDHFSTANTIVTDARSDTNRYTDVDTIKARILESLEKGEQLI